MRSRLGADQYAQLSEAAHPADVIDVSVVVDDLRMRKSDWEIDQIRLAAEQAHEALDLADRLVQGGASDLDAQLAVEAWFRRSGHPGLGHGAASEGATVVVLAGPDSAIPAYLNAPLGGPGSGASAPAGPRGCIPADDEPVIVDLVGHHAGYFADQTRTLVRGELSPRLANALEVSEEALAAMVRIPHPGARAADVYSAAAEVVAAAGLIDHWMGVGEAAVKFGGHGIGLAMSEPPYFTPSNDTEVAARTVVALEPKLVFEGLGTVGVEHTYLVHEHGAERLTLAAGQVPAAAARTK